MTYKLIVASAHHVPEIADKSVHLIVCSPPYFNLRQYSGNQAVEWPTVSYAPIAGMPEITIKGCDADCVHEWVDGPVKTQTPQRDHDSNGNFGDTRGTEASRQGMAYKVTQGAYCIHCGGWRGGLGSEETIESFIGHLVLVLREMWRVLRDDGSLFFNIGSSFAANRSYQVPDNKHKDVGNNHGSKAPPGIRPKNDMLIPARFALAAQADGWIVRSAMPWIKRNGLPDSAEDRPGQAIESVFMLVKQERYYFDMEAVKQPVADSSINRLSQDIENQTGTTRANGGAKTNGNLKAAGSLNGRNLRAADLFFRTWEGMLLDDCGDPLAMVINPKGYAGPHYGVFPPELPEMAILCGTSAAGVCAKCGAPYRRCVEKIAMPRDVTAHRGESKWAVGAATRNDTELTRSGQEYNRWKAEHPDITTGWQPSCTCPAHTPIPAVVLDPFVGSGTTCMVAEWLGRDSIGLDLSDEYHTLAHERINTPRERVENKRTPAEGQIGLFEELAL